jgi:hypothetical protein
VEPWAPLSSSPKNANRTMFCSDGSAPSWVAISSRVATPEPLSTMPGPSVTESRWAPIITTWPGSPVRVWAMTLRCGPLAPSPFSSDASKVGVLGLKPASRSTPITYSTLAS